MERYFVKLVFRFLRYVTRSGIAELLDKSSLTFEELPHCFHRLLLRFLGVQDIEEVITFC